MSDILARANALIGAPYRLHGEDPSGWDCIGLVRWVRREWFGRQTPLGGARYGQADAADPARVEALFLSHMDGWRRLDGPRPGCVVLFERIGRVDHVGVMLDRRTFLHAETPETGTASGELRGRWGRRARGFYELA